MRTDEQREWRRNYRAKLKRLNIEFSLKESDLVAHLEKQPNGVQYIKGLIRADMARKEESE